MRVQVILVVLVSILVLNGAQGDDQCQLRAYPNEKRYAYSDNVLPVIDETFTLNLISVG